MTSEAKAKLLANLYLAEGSWRLRTPDFSPPMVSAIREMFGDCSPEFSPASFLNPVICFDCGKKLGEIHGLASTIITEHQGCYQRFEAEPPWFKTEGFYLIAFAAFPNKRHRAELLTHYIITEFLRNESIIKRKPQQTSEPRLRVEFLTSLSIAD